MTILAGDILLLESDTMTDADEGGGAVTGNVIVDGVSNNIFDDISTLDRVYGAVHMRKIFGSIKTQNTDKYYGSHVIISQLPGDEKIGVNLFNTQDWFDRRSAAQGRVENYLAQGGVYNGHLWATQYQGSRVVTLFQSESAPIPGVSDVLILISSTAEQYIRITRIDARIDDFTDSLGSFSRRIIELEISDALEQDFIGSGISRYDDITSDAQVFNTVVANAARYYTAQRLASAGSIGDLQVKAASVYSQIVPSAQAETPVIDANASGTTTPIIESSQAPQVFSVSYAFSNNINLYLGSAMLPGSLSIAVSGDTLIDSAGQLKNGAGIVVGTVNYYDGLCRFGSLSPTYTGSKTVTFTPAAAPQRLADTSSIAVTAANRGYVWTLNINPAPKPTSLRVAYRALNKWYELTDNGAGGLTASDASIGSGSVSYSTGSVTLTLGTLPDADSDIIFSWGANADFFNRSNFAIKPLILSKTLTNAGVIISSIVIAWNDGVARSMTTNTAGILSGDGTGQYNPVTQLIEFSPDSLPLGGTTFTFDYDYATDAVVTDTFSNVSPASDIVTLPLSAVPILGSLSMIIPTWYASFTDLSEVTLEAENIYFNDLDKTDPSVSDSNIVINGIIDRAGQSIEFDNVFDRGRVMKTAEYDEMPVDIDTGVTVPVLPAPTDWIIRNKDVVSRSI